MSNIPSIQKQTPKLIDPIANDADFLKYLKKIKTFEEIRIVFFGTPEFSAYILEKLINFSDSDESLFLEDERSSSTHLKFVVQTVVTSPDKPVGRKQEVTSSVVSKMAEKYGITTLKPESLDEEFFKNNLAFLEADLFIVVSFGKIIPKKILEIPKIGAINIHGSLLPKYRGASPIQQTILNGDKETGVTIMLMDEKMDHGPILFTKTIELSEEDNYLTLSNKMMVVSAEVLLETIGKFARGEVVPKKQDHTQASFCSTIKKEDGYFELDNPPPLEKLDRMIRAYYPWPTAWTRFRQGSSGQAKIVKFLPRQMVQIEGKKTVKLDEFLRGYPDFPIKSLK